MPASPGPSRSARSMPLLTPSICRSASVSPRSSSRRWIHPRRRPMSGDPGPIRARGASPSNDGDIERRLIFRRRVGTHVVLREAFHPEPRGSSGGLDPIAGLAFLGFLEDAVDVDGAASPEGPERGSKVVHRGMRKIQDDPVHGGDLPEDGVRVPLTYRDMVRPIRCDVLSKKSYRPWIRIRSVNLARSAPLRDEDRVRPDPREGVRDRFAGFDQIRDPFSLRRESRTEVGSRQVHAIVQAVLRVNGGGPRLSRDDVDLPDPVLPLHTAILEDDTDLRIPPPDGVADGHPELPQFLRNLDYRDVADDVKGARQQPAGRGRDLSDIVVTRDVHESFLELSFLPGKAEADAFSGREENRVVLVGDPNLFQQHAAFEEGPPNFLRAFARNDDRPSSHGSCDKRGC